MRILFTDGTDYTDCVVIAPSAKVVIRVIRAIREQRYLDFKYATFGFVPTSSNK
jgi:hypothetical protein